MNTVNLIVGKKYIINGYTCEIVFNGNGWKANILNGIDKGKQLTSLHTDNLNIIEL